MTDSRYSSFRDQDTGHWTQSLNAFSKKRCFIPLPTTAFSFWTVFPARNSHPDLMSLHRIPHQGSTQENQSFREPMADQIGHSQAPIERILTADLSTDHRISISPQQLGEGLLKRQRRILTQKKYRDLVKDL